MPGGSVAGGTWAMGAPSGGGAVRNTVVVGEYANEATAGGVAACGCSGGLCFEWQAAPSSTNPLRNKDVYCMSRNQDALPEPVSADT
ncbi:hypothetical protein GCM10027345_13800 [Hymenobacter daeguensis]